VTQLRLAKSTDATDLARAITAAYAPFRDAGIDLPDVAGGIEDDIALGRVWVAEEGGVVLGALVVDLSGTRAHLMNVAVAPAAKGRGLGRVLVDKAVDLAREAGFQQIFLTTHRLMDSNVALYRHLGWRVSGREADKVFMVRDVAKSEGGTA